MAQFDVLDMNGKKVSDRRAFRRRFRHHPE